MSAEGIGKGSMLVTFDAQGLIPAIVQDAATGEVLTVAYMNRDALRKTVESGQSWFWSRSRSALWHKGETSGNYQDVEEMRLDCDGDALLFRVKPAGPACHTGAPSCFFGKLEPEDALEAADTEAPLEPPGPDLVEEVFQVVLERQRNRPPGSYVAGLLDSGIDGIARKIGEEAIEVVLAAKDGDTSQIVWEVADLWFHSLVLLAAKGLKPADIWAEFQRRRT